jgi:hypothetical protein
MFAVKTRPLLSDTRFVEHILGFEDSLLRRLQHSIQTTQNAHWQNHIRILAAFEQ